MRQLTFVEKGMLEWRDAPDARLEGEGQAVVRPVALATCDIDTAFVQGRFPVGDSFSFGHECVAEVTEIGDSVTSVEPGDLVSVPFQISCGECARCRAGEPGNCQSVPRLSTYGLPIGPQTYGGFASDAVNVSCRFPTASSLPPWRASPTTSPTPGDVWPLRSRRGRDRPS